MSEKESFFPADFFIQNRKKLRKLFSGTAPIVITANGLMQRNGDTNSAFRQDSSFWYLTGLTNPDLILVIDKTKEYLIVPEREKIWEVFDGPIDYSALLNYSGIEQILPEKEGWKRLASRLKKSQHVATLIAPPAYIKHYHMYSNPARARLSERIKEINPNIEHLDLRPHLTKMRMIKQENELNALKEAISITNKTLKEIKRRLPKYQNESEIAGEISYKFWKYGADGHAYTPIVAQGKNATTLHYVKNNAKLEKGNLILFDVGAEVHGYAADISRTYAYGACSKRQQAVYDAAAEVQQFAFGLLKPGVIFKEYEKQIENFMGEKLRELGLIRSISKENVRKYYPHATSHMLGLDVHDVANYKTPLAEGMVMTVEPGIYIGEEGIGVRIEDDVIITKNGIKNLSANLPTTLR